MRKTENFIQKNHTYKTLTPKNIITSPSSLSVKSLFSNSKKQLQIKIGKYVYKESEILGVGLTSIVYLGNYINNDNHKVAIKVIEKTKFKGRNLQMLDYEIQIHSKIQHQNIVHCLDIYKQNDKYYLVLEYCPNGDLRSYIFNRKITQNMAINIMQQIISAYQYLIKHKIIHRDLKPQNIFKCGKKWKIGDFGFALQNKKTYIDTLYVGTSLYLPPQSLQAPFYTAKTDIFSLGVIMYELVVNNCPWQGQTQEQIMINMKQNPLNIANNPKITQSCIKQFIKRCCELNFMSRISIEQFSQLNLRQLIYSESTKEKLKSENIIYPIKKNQKNLQNNIFEKNNQILLRQIQKYEHLSCMMDNINVYQIQYQTKQLYGMLINRHMLYILNTIIITPKNNRLHLQNLLSYKRTQYFKSAVKQALQLYKDADNKYNKCLGSKNIKTLRIANRMFSQLQYDKDLPQKFYITLSNFLLECMQQHMESLNNLQNIHQKDQIYLNKYYQALLSLKQYYDIVINQMNTKYKKNDLNKTNSQQLQFSLLNDYAESQFDYQHYRQLRMIIWKLSKMIVSNFS